MPRKLIEFHAEDLRALAELAEDRSASVQELLDEAARLAEEAWQAHRPEKRAA